MTGTDIAVRNGAGALAIRPGQDMFTDKQRAALAVLGIKDATNADLAVFMHYCQKTGLDPFSRQIYLITRREKVGGQYVAKQTIQVGIDGFRVIRDRIAARLGITVEYEDTIWYDAEGRPHKVWLWDEPPAACCVTVIRDGKRFPGVVRTSAYMQTNAEGKPVSQWRSQPDHMIEKCAEAFALRRAFPQDLGGLYIEEEAHGAPAMEAAQNARVTAAEIIREPAKRGRKAHIDQGEQGINIPLPELITAQWERLGVGDLEEQLVMSAALAGQAGTFFDSIADLSHDEQQRVLSALKRCATIADVHALAVSGDAPEGGADDAA